MSLKKSLIKNTAFNLFSYLYLLVASFFSIPILLSHLGRDLFGIYLLLASVVPLFSILDFGLGQAVIRKLALPYTDRDRKIKIWQTSFSLYLVTGLFIVLMLPSGLFVLTDQLKIFAALGKTTTKLVVIILTLTALVNHLNTFFLTLPQSRQRFDIYNIKTIVVGSGNTIISAIVVTFIPSLLLVFLVQLGFNLLTSILLMIYVLNSGLKFFPKLYLKIAKDLIFFGLRYFIGVASSQIKQQFSKYVLGVMLSASAITAFSIPLNIVIKSAAAIQQLSLAFFPMSASLLRGDRIKKLKRLVVVIQTSIFVVGLFQLLIVHLFGEQFLLWWLNDEVIASLSFAVLKILSFYFILTTLTPVPTVVLESMNYPHIPSFFAIFSAVFYILLVLFLTPRYLVLGPAYATVLVAGVNVPLFLFVFIKVFNKAVKKIEEKDKR